MENLEERRSADGREDYAKDGTVDLKGRPVLRSKTGRWRACYFMIGYEIFERMAYYGIESNLVVYLTKKLHEGTVTSSKHAINWVGTACMLPILGACIADAYLGRFWTFLIASAIYLMGMILLTLAVSVPSLRPPSCGPSIEDCAQKASALQKGIFYAALYIIAAGTGGTKPNISTMGADQFDDFDPKERTQKLSFFNWWMFSIFFGTLFCNAFLVYIQDKVGWALGYALPTVGLAVSIAVFLVGTPFYRHKLPAGSPFTRILQVLVAALRKQNVYLPNDPKSSMSLAKRSTHQRMGIGFVLHVIIMITAFLAERRRLIVAREHNINKKDDIVPLSVFILVPQFALMGVANTFVEVAKLEFFYDQAPEGMKSLGTSYSTSSLGIGNFLSNALLKTVDDITKKHGHEGWILDNLNISHLDYYYAFLAVLMFLNFLIFLVVATFFVYKIDVDSIRDSQEATEA
ncbi:hypothetical protein GH714_026915 [Hevea brasiliensis]|uniref:Major facilitator superfamily (MFS) profile domain-containing protein n=1 Tax=Hevea brasiliensis TaxID=3981 RepID=A0A6A6L4A5_HEVBR|nr:hypothetical protein GH714_026915 [Hevea brasiliensis]